MVWCQSCNEDVEAAHDSGFTCCPACGRVVEDFEFASDVQFAKGPDGDGGAVGQFVGANGEARGASRFSGGQMWAAQGDSHENSAARGRQEISALVDHFRVTPTSDAIDASHRLYRLALQRGFTRGRRVSLVAATCLYIYCRQEDRPYMLIDFADHLSVNVFVLGAVYLQLLRLFCLEDYPTFSKPQDPSLYLHRFVDKLKFGDKAQAVSSTALKLVQSMKRDWMQTGRRPAGICGAALFIAAHIHGIERSKRDIIGVVHVGWATVEKRVVEFAHTQAAPPAPPAQPPPFDCWLLQAGELTVDEFSAHAQLLEQDQAQLMLTYEQQIQEPPEAQEPPSALDPPAAQLADGSDGQLVLAGQGEQQQGGKAGGGAATKQGCEHVVQGRPHFAHGMCRDCFDQFLRISGGMFKDAVFPPSFTKGIVKAVHAEVKALVVGQAAAAATPTQATPPDKQQQEGEAGMGCGGAELEPELQELEEALRGQALHSLAAAMGIAAPATPAPLLPPALRLGRVGSGKPGEGAAGGHGAAKATEGGAQPGGDARGRGGAEAGVEQATQCYGEAGQGRGEGGGQAGGKGGPSELPSTQGYGSSLASPLGSQATGCSQQGGEQQGQQQGQQQGSQQQGSQQPGQSAAMDLTIEGLQPASSQLPTPPCPGPDPTGGAQGGSGGEGGEEGGGPDADYQPTGLELALVPAAYPPPPTPGPPAADPPGVPGEPGETAGEGLRGGQGEGAAADDSLALVVVQADGGAAAGVQGAGGAGGAGGAALVVAEAGGAVVCQEESLSDLDDSELDCYIASHEEAQMKEALWTAMNQDWIDKQAAKAAAAEAAGSSPAAKPKRTRKPGSGKTGPLPPAGTAEDAARAVIEARKLSNKINYTALGRLFSEQEGEEGQGSPGCAGEGEGPGGGAGEEEGAGGEVALRKGGKRGVKGVRGSAGGGVQGAGDGEGEGEGPGSGLGAQAALKQAAEAEAAAVKAAYRKRSAQRAAEQEQDKNKYRKTLEAEQSKRGSPSGPGLGGGFLSSLTFAGAKAGPAPSRLGPGLGSLRQAGPRSALG
ncbi:hypothetical protein QJQ45_018910 [Haematococcus lacustris]|nr:hypothetical protein QJQ45_018910 [Haematococcus lacustris]